MEKLAECPRRLGDARRKTHPRSSRARGKEGGGGGEKPSSGLSTPRSIPRNVFAPVAASLFSLFFSFLTGKKTDPFPIPIASQPNFILGFAFLETERERQRCRCA